MVVIPLKDVALFFEKNLLMIMMRLLITLAVLLAVCPGFAQNSLLVNFGSNTCVAPTQPSFSLIKNPLGNNPIVLTQCAMGNQLPNFYAVFISYNPKDNNIYIADVRTFTQSRIWRLDVGLPEAIACPLNIPATPTYTHNYVSNNFEFDNNGDLWSFSNFDGVNGRCNLDKFDVETGNIINTRVLQFPTGNFPTAITSGDLCILPNGRMFATLGDSPSRLYEIENYTAPNTTVAVKFLQALPNSCYGIAYLNGLLEVTGTNLTNSCYYFTYDFTNNVLSEQKPFQNGQAPIDNTSITPTIGSTKRLVSATKINANTADIVYEIFVRNMGNTILNEVNIIEDLGKVFGAANVSDVAASFVPGNNVAGLTLNPSFNGTTETMVLQPGQSLPNQTGNNQDYFVKVQVSCRVTNLSAQQVYLNSAIATATINNEVDKVIITDSSNNGLPDVVDPNNNVNPTESGENIPTPFDFSLLPVKFLGFEGRLNKSTISELRWRIAVPTSGADYFEIQWSEDAAAWKKGGMYPITNTMQSDYYFLHEHNAPPELYYRLKQVDKDGVFIYSSIIKLRQTSKEVIQMYPNPAADFITITLPANRQDRARIMLYDMNGRRLVEQFATGFSTTIPVSKLPAGLYRMVITQGTLIESKQITIIR
jgi:hypothetical protein